MSLFSPIFGFPGYSGFGWGWNGSAASAPLAETAPPTDKPVKPQDPIDTQSNWSIIGPRSYYPGFDKAPPGGIGIYWKMRQYSAIVLAHAVATAPILAGTQSIEIADDRGNPAKAEQWQEEAAKHIIPLMADLLPGAMEAPHFGAWLQEIVWGVRDGLIVPVAFRSFLPGEAVIYRDEYRNFAGFKVGDQYRDSRYGFLAVNEPHLDPLYGYSRNENCREDWWRAIKSNENADRIERKAAGIQMGIGIPMGQTFTDSSGNPVISQATAQTLTDAAAEGKTFTYPLTPFSKADIVRDPKLADIPAIKIQPFDWGDTAPAILAQVERLNALDTRIMRAWRRPERESMEGQHGTKAEAGVHGQIGVTDSELIHAGVLRQFTRQVLDRYMLANYGPEAVGVLYVKPAPLSDPQQEFLQQVWLAQQANATTGPNLALKMDEDSLGKRLEVPMVDEATFEARKQEAEQKAADQQKQQLDAMKQSANGNGKMNGNGKRMALAVDSLNRIGEFLAPDEDE